MPADNAEAFEIRKLNSKSVGSDSDKKVEFGVVQQASKRGAPVLGQYSVFEEGTFRGSWYSEGG